MYLPNCIPLRFNKIEKKALFIFHLDQILYLRHFIMTILRMVDL